MNIAAEQIGIIGVGLLGSAIAERILSAGFTVLGYDSDQSRLDKLAQLGGNSAENSAQVAQNCDRIILSLPNSEISSRVVNEMEDLLVPGNIILDTTTGDPQHSTASGEKLQEKKIDYLDATVAGSSEQARQGEVLVMVGGSEKAFQDCEDIFSCFAREIFYLGLSGSGARMKLVFNLVLGLNRAVLAEGLSMAEHCGIDPQQALDILQAGAAFSQVMETKGQKMIQEDFTPQARLAQHLKDVDLILEFGKKNRASLPLCLQHRELLEKAVSLGHGLDDNSAIIKVYQ